MDLYFPIETHHNQLETLDLANSNSIDEHDRGAMSPTDPVFELSCLDGWLDLTQGMI